MYLIESSICGKGLIGGQSDGDSISTDCLQVISHTLSFGGWGSGSNGDTVSNGPSLTTINIRTPQQEKKNQQHHTIAVAE